MQNVEEKVIKVIKSKAELKNASVEALYNINWKDYLELQDYNKDINKMCELCRAEQIREYGKITIECSGIKDRSYLVPSEYEEMFTDEELKTIDEVANPATWGDNNIDVDRKDDPEKRKYARRWYQDQIISCSAKKKIIRCGRRIGKTFGIGVDITHRMMTRNGYRILTIAPYSTQSKEVAEAVRNNIRFLAPWNGDWKSLVKTSNASPYHYIALNNLSSFKGFTSSSNDAESVRGQGGDLIYMDETDYLSQGAMDSITAIMLDNPETELIMTSTPATPSIMKPLEETGEYKVFHFPSFVLPYYDDKMDAQLRASTSMSGYVREYMGEYVSEHSAAFDLDYLYLARTRKRLFTNDDVLSDRSNYIVSLGCDWNGDKVGTRIIVLAMNRTNNQISVIKTDNVRKEGWTQALAINKIIAVNRIYSCDHIYVDEGFGQSNVQQLKLHAVNNYGRLPVNHPDLLLDEVVALNFASTIDLEDVMTGEVRKKYIKNFVVEIVRRLLEGENLTLEGEDADGIYKQASEYMIKSVTSTNREIYEARNPQVGDHDLDAFMFAVAGLYFNHESILNTGKLSTLQMSTVDRSEPELYNDKSIITPRIDDETLSGRTSRLFQRRELTTKSRSRTDISGGPSIGGIIPSSPTSLFGPRLGRNNRGRTF